MKNVWWVGQLENFSNRITVEDIKKECELLELEQQTHKKDAGEYFIFKGQSQNDLQLDFRRSKLAYITNNRSEIWLLMNEIAETINQEHFGFDINKVEVIQYAVYNEQEKSKYDWHIDTTFANDLLWQRKISISIQLSNPNEYEGGELELDGFHYDGVWRDFKDRAKQKGAVTVFPSFMPHRVTEVTKGTRASLAAWITGVKFK